jgi:putative membrane protein insertion efficiency factor
VTAASLVLIRVYRVTLGPLFGLISGCRFTPTCSQYGYEAIQKYGWRRGWWMAVKRIGRCHPFHEGGWDPVP